MECDGAVVTEEEIRERDAKCGFGKDHNKVIMGWQAEKDRRWLLRELDRVRKDLVICRKSKSVYDYSDKMSERLNAEVNHLLKEQVKRLEQQLFEAQQALLTEGMQRDKLRELLVEAMVTACEDVRDEIDWAGSEGGWEEQTSKCYELHDWGWPPWFEDAARLIFQMRRGE